MASSSEPVDDRLLASYEARHRILLVGEGDFSFTEALSNQLPSGQVRAGDAPLVTAALRRSARLVTAMRVSTPLCAALRRSAPLL